MATDRWSSPSVTLKASLIRLETVTDFDRSCYRVLQAERPSLARLHKFPLRSNFQQNSLIGWTRRLAIHGKRAFAFRPWLVCEVHSGLGITKADGACDSVSFRMNQVLTRHNSFPV